MKFVPREDRLAWHAKAIEAATGAHLQSHIDLLLHTKETKRLAELIDRSLDKALEDVSYYVAEEAARRLETPHPADAARLWRAQAIRILDEKRSKLYGVALRHLERAKRCYERAGNAVD